MAFGIKYSKSAIKTISAIESKTKQRIKDAIEGIPAGDIKSLQGDDVATPEDIAECEQAMREYRAGSFD